MSELKKIVGGRFGIDINWFNSEAMNTIESSDETVGRYFPGFRLYAVTGFDIPLNQRISLRISGMPGWQFYSISDNWEISTGSSSTINIDTTNATSYNRFIFQINAGLAIRLWKK